MQFRIALFFLGLFMFYSNLWASTSSNESPIYLGLGVGASFLSPNVASQYSSYQVQQDLDTAVSVSLGYAWHRNWTSEFSIAELGQFRLLNNDTLSPTQENIKYQAIGVNTQYHFKEDLLRVFGFKNAYNGCPPFCNVEPFVSAGFNDLNVKSNGDNVQNNRLYPSFGMGLEFKFTVGLIGRLSYTAYSGDAQLLGLSVLATLGGSKKQNYSLSKSEQAELTPDPLPASVQEPLQEPLQEPSQKSSQKPSHALEQILTPQEKQEASYAKIQDALERHKLALAETKQKAIETPVEQTPWKNCATEKQSARDTCIPEDLRFHYGLGQSSLTAAQQLELNGVIELLNQNKEIKLKVSGHSDSIGRSSENQQLSMDRLAGVRDYLTHQGIDSTRISFVAYGESKPTASNETAAGRAANRRVEFSFEHAKSQVVEVGSVDIGSVEVRTDDSSAGEVVAVQDESNNRNNQTKAVELRQPCDSKLLFLADGCLPENLRFNYAKGKSNLSRSQQSQLNQLAKVLNQSKDIKLTVTGHADSTGRKHRNQLLSIDRIDAVLEHLEAAGVDSSRLAFVAYGETKPIASNATAEGRAQNRRVEFSFGPM